MRRKVLTSAVVFAVVLGHPQKGHAGDHNKCTVGVAGDGRPTVEGDCVYLFTMDGDTMFTLRLDDAAIAFTPEKLEVELIRGTIRDVAGTKTPTIVVHGTEHSASVDISEVGLVVRADKEHISVMAETGQTIVTTTFGNKIVLSDKEGQNVVHVDLVQPSAESTQCSVRFAGKAPKHREALLIALVAACFLLRMRRSGRISRSSAPP